MTAAEVMGDPHNFGRRVIMFDRHVEKPRTVAWERALLSVEGALRCLLAPSMLARDIDPWASIGSLSFYMDDICGGGRVERLRLPGVAGSLSSSEWCTVGSVVGLCAWLGIGDLHRDNVAIGRDETGLFRFTPIDIECILNDFSLPTQTALLPASGLTASACGLATLLRNPLSFDEVAAFVTGYLLAIDCAESVGTWRIFEALDAAGMRRCPIRLIYRPTVEYQQLRSALPQEDRPVQVPEEAAQSARGDIPYFFRHYDAGTSYWYETPDEPKPVAFAPVLMERVHSRLLLHGGNRRNLQKLMDAGSLLCARILASGLGEGAGMFRGTSVHLTYDEIAISVGARTIRTRRT